MTTLILEKAKRTSKSQIQCHHCLLEKYLRQNNLWDQELELLYNQETCK